MVFHRRRLLGVSRPFSGLDSATTAWINAVVTAGGAVSSNQQTRVNNLIAGLKSDSVWTLLDRLWLWAGESDAHQATIDIVNLGVGINQNGLVLGATGYAGDHTNKYFDTQVALNSLTNYQTNAATLGVYSMVSRATSQTWRDGGCDDGSNFSQLTTLYNDGKIHYNLNTNTAVAPANTDVQGQWICTRNGGSTTVIRKNGTAFNSDATQTATGAPSRTMYFFAYNNGTPVDNSGDTLGCGLIGGGMTTTQMDNLASRINAYMTAWGVNVY